MRKQRRVIRCRATDETAGTAKRPIRIAPGPTELQVDAFYRAALEAGGKDNGAPGLRPRYHPNYHAAFVIGPDGHNIEAVCTEPDA
jgi:hypothetical protein